MPGAGVLRAAGLDDVGQLVNVWGEDDVSPGGEKGVAGVAAEEKA